MTQEPSDKELSRRIACLEKLKSDLEKTCREHEKSGNLLNAIRKAQSLYITGEDPAEVYKLLLKTLVEITDSEYGFLDEVFSDESGGTYKKNLAISDISWDEESRRLYNQLQERDMKFEYLQNLSGLPALTGKTVISNDPSNDSRARGVPEGHPRIRSFLGMPMFFGGRLVCIAGVANRKGGYTEKIADFLEPLLSTCAGITYALRKEAEEKEREKRLEESEEKYRLIVENQDDIIVKFDHDGRILFASPSYCRTFGFEEEELTGSSFYPLVYREDVEKVRASVEDLKKPPHKTYDESRMMTVKGLRWFGWSVRAVLDDRDQIVEFIAVGRDITEQKRLQNESMQAHKMQAIGTLAGGVAHEFNNALSVITGNLDLMEEDFSDNEQVISYASEMKASAERMRRLTSQLLAYARGGKYQASVLSLNDFIREVIPIIMHSVDTGIELDTSIPEEDIKAEADPAQMQMMLSAVLSNASEAIEGNGHIRVMLSKVRAGESKALSLKDFEPGAYACITVTDDGIGMDEETKSRIFEPFFTTGFQGRGLGMAAALGIAENHGGSVSVDSEPGRGTAVYIYLPAAESRAGEEHKHKTQKELSPGKGTALVVEDEEEVRALSRAVLERLGWLVLEAETGKQALYIVQTYKGGIDIALVDYVMPDMKADVLCPLLKSFSRDLKVIVNSGYSLDQSMRDVSDAGAEGFIQKPFTKKELSEKINAVLGAE